MSANLLQINGKAALALHRQAAWHGQGTIVQQFANATDALTVAGIIDAEYRKVAIPALTVDGQAVPLPDQFAVVRSPLGTAGWEYVGTVSENYKLMQPGYVAGKLDPFSTPDKWAVESCGMIGKGEKWWIQLNVPEGDFVVGHDDFAEREAHKAYLLVADDTTGNAAFSWKAVYKRVVCENTYDMAIAEIGSSLSFPHDGDPALMLAFVAQVQDRVINKLAATRSELRRMFEYKVTPGEALEIINAALPLPVAKEDDILTRIINGPDAKTVKPELLEKAKARVDVAQRNYANTIARVTERRDLTWQLLGKFNDEQPYAANTAYAVVNVVNEMADHLVAGTRGDRAAAALDPNSWRYNAKKLARDFTVKRMGGNN